MTEAETIEIKDTTNPLVCVLRDPREQAILTPCVTAFEMADKEPVPIDDLILFCSLKGVHTDKDEIWKILWCKSNLDLRYVPKYRALRWRGKFLKNKSWHWEIRKREDP